MYRSLLTAAALALVPLAAQAEEAWPPEIQALVEEAKGLCGGDFSTSPESAVEVDLNGDGTKDWLLDHSTFQCSESTTLYCGTEGCAVDTLIDGKVGSLLLHDWEVVEDGGKVLLRAPADGGTADFVWDGAKGEWVLQ